MDRTNKELRDLLWQIARDTAAAENRSELAAPLSSDLLYELSRALERMESNIAAAAAKEKLLLLAKLKIEMERLYKELHDSFFEDMCYFDAGQILYNCTIDDEGLKDADGEIICSDGRCIDEPLGYFVDQWSGYCEDDYHGNMYIPVDDKGTVVVVSYDC